MKKRILILILVLLRFTTGACAAEKQRHDLIFTCPTESLYPGDTFQFTATSATGTPVFSSANPKVLEITPDGYATATQWGSTEVILTVAETEEYAELVFHIPVEVSAAHDPTPDTPDPPYEPTEPTQPEEEPVYPGRPTQFLDVTHEDYFAGAVDWAVDHAVTTGVDESHFAPDSPCTRGQVATFLWRAMDCPEPDSLSSPFKDVQDPDAYYYKAVLWAAEQGITTGTSADRFSPDGFCTRAQVVTFLWRMDGRQTSVWGIQFSDVTQGQYYTEAVSWAVEHGITQGTGLNRFLPDKTCTRAEIVTFLFRHLR